MELFQLKTMVLRAAAAGINKKLDSGATDCHNESRPMYISYSSWNKRGKKKCRALKQYLHRQATLRPASRRIMWSLSCSGLVRER